MNRQMGRITRSVCIMGYLFIAISLNGQTRTEINFPDILGYKTLKCDFHMHTVFSDGVVWPTVRVNEAWREGLDAISITEHIESGYHSFPEHVSGDHNSAYEIAKSLADDVGLLLIHGGEITRDMPPGHMNAIFLENANPLEEEIHLDAVKAAADQGAFLMWNHPGWTGQQPDGLSRWYEEHTILLEKGWMHGIEIVNELSYYPEVHQWCLDKNLTLIGNSDIHDPTTSFFNFHGGEHRTMTLVFAKDRSIESIRDALFDRRTVVYLKDRLIGDEKFLKALVDASTDVLTKSLSLTGRSRKVVQIQNKSQVPLKLEALDQSSLLEYPKSLTIPGESTQMFSVRAITKDQKGNHTIRLAYRVTNFWTTPDTRLRIEFPLDVTFQSVNYEE